MSRASAYILRLSAKRVEDFEWALSIDGRFAEAVDEFYFSRRQTLLCLVVNSSGTITHIARATRGVRAATALRRLNVTDVYELREPIASRRIVHAVSNRVRHWVTEKFSTGGLLSPKSFEEVIDAIRNISSETRPILDRFSREARTRFARLSIESRTSLAYQKESIATALFVSGMDRSVLADWTIDSEEEPTSFLDGLEQVRLREDSMIVHDLMNVPGYRYIMSIPNVAAARFQDDHTTLTVALANRLILESQTGTDLIYYNDTFKAFVMVQYKAMDDSHSEGAVFRFPQEDLDREVKKMNRLLAQIRKLKPSKERESFRFSDNPFFLKFCPRLQLEPDTSGLIKGMYLPLDYWILTESDPAMVGPRGGKRLTYSNVGRYLDNSAFATLVSRAWVGTTISQSALLESWIEQSLTDGKAVAFAIKREDLKSPDEELLVDSPIMDDETDKTLGLE